MPNANQIFYPLHCRKDAWKPIKPNQNILTGKNPSIQDKLLIRIYQPKNGFISKMRLPK